MLELVVVMSIMILIIGIGFGSFAVFDDVDPFEKPAQRMTQMAKFALNAAIIQHRGLTIAFDETGFGVLGASAPDSSRFELPSDMKVLIRRWGGKGWEKAEGQTWQFGQQGICEPVKIRFETKEGSREMTFHPLTGSPTD